jgi:hypothetical protein
MSKLDSVASDNDSQRLVQVIPQTFRIVDENDNTVDGLTGLNLIEAEKSLTRQLNLDVDCYIQEESILTQY